MPMIKANQAINAFERATISGFRTEAELMEAWMGTVKTTDAKLRASVISSINRNYSEVAMHANRGLGPLESWNPYQKELFNILRR